MLTKTLLLHRRSKPESRDRDSTSDRAKPDAEREHSRRSSDQDERQRRGHEHAQSTDRHASDQSQQQTHTDTDIRDQPRNGQEREFTHARDSSARDKREPEQDSNQRRPPARRSVVNPNSKQAELLASVASEMNTFSNDGSFMERFAAKQAGESGRGSEEDAQPSGAADAAELSLSGMTHAAEGVVKAKIRAVPECNTECV